MKSFVIVSHKYLPQPDDDLVFFLNQKRKKRVLHVMHHFPDMKDRKSSFNYFLKGKKIKSKRSPDYSFLPEALIYLKEFIYTLIWTIQWNKRSDIYIGMDGLCTLFGLGLKRFGIVGKVVFWSIDFVPHNRFSSNWKNRIYHRINIIALKNADEVWDLTSKMREGRKKYFGIKNSDYKNYKVVPYGVWIKRIKTIPYKKCQKSTLVFMGHLLSKQGIDMVINKIPEIIKKIPDFKFKIIGDGKHKETLVKLAKDLKVYKYCDFIGNIKDNKDLEEEIAKSVVAIAPYKKSRDNYTYYADPGKVKTYLACGAPVLLTEVPWNAEEIEKRRCGIIIKDDGSDLITKLLYIIKPSINQKFRKNTIKYSLEFDYQRIFNNLI